MLIMTIEEAYSAVQFYGRDLWKSLAQMNSEWDDLDIYDKTAYKMVKRELEKEMTNGN
jgi:hypothetical protein